MEESEVFHLQENGFSLVFSKGQWKLKERHSDEGYGIRILDKGKLGFGFCQNEKEIPKAKKQAKTLAKFSPKTKFSFQSNKEKTKAKTENKTIASIQPEELKEMLDKLLNGAKKYAKHIRIHSQIDRMQLNLENPFFEKAYGKTEFALYAEATIGDGFGFYHFSNIQLPLQDWEEIGKEIGKMAKDMQHAKKPNMGKYNVVFAPEALHDILGVLLPSFSGDLKRRGMSKLGSKQGMKMFHPQFSLYEDGSLTTIGVRPFDDEGTATQRIPLVKNGIVKNFQYDRETAALAGIKEEGSCSRNGYDSLPIVGGASWMIEKGDIESIENEAKEFLYIKSLHGTHTANTTTGEFGVEVNIGFHIRNGKREPIRGFLITENVFNLFKRIKYIEKTQKIYDDLITPLILFEGIKVIK